MLYSLLPVFLTCISLAVTLGFFFFFPGCIYVDALACLLCILFSAHLYTCFVCSTFLVLTSPLPALLLLLFSAQLYTCFICSNFLAHTCPSPLLSLTCPSPLVFCIPVYLFSHLFYFPRAYLLLLFLLLPYLSLSSCCFLHTCLPVLSSILFSSRLPPPLPYLSS